MSWGWPVLPTACLPQTLEMRAGYFLPAAPASVSASASLGVGLLSEGLGTWIRVPQFRQRTVLPRALTGTDRIVRHWRFGHRSRTALGDIVTASRETMKRTGPVRL